MAGTLGSKFLRLAGWLGYLGLLALLFVLSAYTSFGLFVRSGVTPTPDLVGLSREQALDELTDRGLQWKDGEVAGRYSEGVPEGYVVEQRPEAGALIKRGKEVRVVISLGQERLTVPDLRGQLVPGAEVALRAAGLRLGRTLSIFRPGSPPGTIVDQSPWPATPISRDSPVDLFLAMQASANAYVMPDLVYRRLEPVKSFFEARGFHLKNVSYEPYDGVREGVILRQSPQAGFPVSQGDAITLVVASGAAGQP
ncbi:MAG TPA: PASTA domain-containing protein [Thermoanaerobaculia bacterium]|nr:PASTA domain-containing protein [Thermoanaerobaculia bacterium]